MGEDDTMFLSTDWQENEANHDKLWPRVRVSVSGPEPWECKWERLRSRAVSYIAFVKITYTLSVPSPTHSVCHCEMVQMCKPWTRKKSALEGRILKWFYLIRYDYYWDLSGVSQALFKLAVQPKMVPHICCGKSLTTISPCKEHITQLLSL